MPVENLQPGMITAQQVSDPTGMLLLKENVELTPVWIQRLKARKVSSVYVVDDGASSSTGGLTEEQIKSKYAEIDKFIDHMFSDCISDDLMAHLAEYARTHLKSKLKV